MTQPQKSRKSRRHRSSPQKERPIVFLRQERQKRGLRKEDIRTGTRIPLKYITMLETGQYPEQIDDHQKAKIKSCRKAYLRYLGLPTNARLKLKKQSTIAAAVQEVTNIFSKTDSLPQSGFFKTLIYSFIGIVFLLSLFRGFNAIIQNQTIEEAAATIAEVEENIEISKKDTDYEISSQRLLKWLLGTPAQATTAKPDSVKSTNGPNVQLRVLEPVHLTVFRDGQLDFKRFVNPIKNNLDKEFDWAYAKELSITVSDISSIALIHNKRPVEPMGDVGTSRTITFRTKRTD
ncbi:MAG: helix-turn-helix domain-containing protein [Myxococcota bacterium]|nr:helix-turn-helix domain-containing protein [Myxococcota bacterium]